MAFINSCELTVSVTALANAIASRCSNDEIGLLALIFTQLDDTLGLIAFQNGLCGK